MSLLRLTLVMFFILLAGNSLSASYGSLEPFPYPDALPDWDCPPANRFMYTFWPDQNNPDRFCTVLVCNYPDGGPGFESSYSLLTSSEGCDLGATEWADLTVNLFIEMSQLNGYCFFDNHGNCKAGQTGTRIYDATPCYKEGPPWFCISPSTTYTVCFKEPCDAVELCRVHFRYVCDENCNIIEGPWQDSKRCIQSCPEGCYPSETMIY
jgi:hypothetical protein